MSEMADYPTYVVDPQTTRAIQSALRDLSREIATLKVMTPLGPVEVKFFTGTPPVSPTSE